MPITLYYIGHLLCKLNDFVSCQGNGAQSIELHKKSPQATPTGVSLQA